MNFQFYLEKLFESENFKKFKKENPKMYLCSGFFSIDSQGVDNKQHIDYCVKGSNKIISFQLESDCNVEIIENINKEDLNEISEKIDFEFNKVEKIIQDKMKKENIKNKIQKILLSLQNINKNDFLIGTVFISGLGIIKIKISIKEMKIETFEKKSFFDMVKVVKKN